MNVNVKVVSYYRQLWIVALALCFNFCGVSAADQTDSNQQRFQQILKSIDVNASPCDNFFGYACGHWNDTGVPNNPNAEAIEQIEFNTNRELKQIFDAEDLAGEGGFLANVYQYYVSCTAATHGPTTTKEYLRWLSVNENFSWPSEMWESQPKQRHQTYDWIELLAMTRRFGFNDLFFHEDVTQRIDERHGMIIELRRPSLQPMDNIWNQIFKHFPIGYKQIFENLGMFHQELLDEMKDDEGIYGDDESQLVALRSLQMPWLNKYLKVLLNQSDLDPSMQLYVQSLEYLKNIHEVLSDYDNALVCDYIYLHYYMFLAQQDAARPRHACMESTRLQFPLAMQWFYSQRHPEVQRELPNIRQMFTNLKLNFKNTLNRNTNQFADKVLMYLTEKLDGLDLVTADVASDELELYYQPLTLNASDYHGNVLKLYNFKFNVAHAALLRPLTRRTALEYLDIRASVGDSLDVATQSALSHLPQLYPRLNVILLPVSLLQYPYYAAGMQDLYSYSAIGFHLGREIAKAFDLDNLEIGADGIYNYDMSFDIQDYDKFDNTARRLKRDFSSVHEVNEVIADLGGLKLAYETFVEMHSDILHQEVVIKGRSMLAKHVFFLNYAHNFCDHGCLSSAMNIGKYNSCSRVNLPLTRFGKFRFGFECPKDRKWGYPMWR